MKIMNVIGGLEEKEVKEIMALFVKTHCEGHNQLCNREIELDLDWLRNKLCLELQTKIVRRILEDFSEAISQGKVLKVKERMNPTQIIHKLEETI